MTAYTHAEWHVVPGREDDFVAAWEELGAWTKTFAPDAAGTLLRDRGDPTRFVSFGPWPSAEHAAE